MTIPANANAIDPLGVFISAHTTHHGTRPIPLVSTHYDISIDGGFAVVESRRVFRNLESESIEATLTLPLPVQAVLFSLEAENDGRKLKAKAQRRSDARHIYECAVDEGKAAVMHEELLRGIHMLSVTHIAPDTEIAVTTRWATTLTRIGEHWQLHIPLTVGQVYGRSPLADSDALESGGADGAAEVVVRCVSGHVRLAGTDLVDGRALVPLSRPIDIHVTGAVSRGLHGVSGDGRPVALHVAPLPLGHDNFDLAILVDRSGSMSDVCSGARKSATKHRAVIDGLTAFATRFRNGDAADLWEFDNELAHVGSTRDERPHWRIRRHGWKPDAAFEQLVRRLREPGGGTEIGKALAGVLSGSPARDLLLITDGKSHALDVHELARAGRRIAVVLVGEDSLEANVGHLAAVTGGSVFIAAGNDIAPIVAAAAETLRSCPGNLDTVEGLPETVEAVRGGAVVRTSWGPSVDSPADERLGRGVAAFAAMLAIARMEEAAAAELAVSEGICSHLTSLVLVDTAAPAQEGIPPMRKVLLPSPPGIQPLFAVGADIHDRFSSFAELPSDRLILQRFAPTKHLKPAATLIDWGYEPAQFLDGDLSSLDGNLAERLREIADDLQVQRWADALKVASIVLVMAALAYSQRGLSRSAERVARKVFGNTPPAWIDELEILVADVMDGSPQVGP